MTSFAFVVRAGALPLPAHFGRAGKPAPLLWRIVFLRKYLRWQAPQDAPSKGDQSPFEEPPALRGGREKMNKEV